jgi:hypothetical protein
MELRSLEPGFRLTLSRNDPNDPYSSYTIRIEARTEFGSFTGENTGIHFSAFPTFLDRLKEFLETRNGEARLDLTEEGELSFFRWNGKGDVGLRFKLSRFAYFRDPTQTHPLTLTGAFPLNGEFLGQMYSELAQLVDRES